MANRKLSLISPTLAEILVKQIAHELKNRNLYLSYANYFSVEGIVDLEKYYRKRAAEENNHHQWIMDYLSNGDFKFIYPAVEENTEKYDDYVTPFKQTIDREILTTQMLYTIYDTAIAEKDFMMGSWLYEKLIKEQIEEENISRMARTIMEETSDIYLRAEKVLNLLES
jgi:ferritin